MNKLQSFDYILPTPIGSMGLNVSDKGIRQLVYLSTKQNSVIPKKGLAAEVLGQLQEYFELRRTEFDLPVDITGTSHQTRVWKEVAKIAYGQSRTYGDIAKKIHSGPRAVGNACRQNPIPIIIPCHRVVSKSSIGGYCGSLVGKQIHQKDWLLQHEVNPVLTNE